MAGCNLPLDHGQIKSRALIMARDLGLIKFKASSKWIAGFINRHNMIDRISQPWDSKRQAHTNKHLVGEFHRILKDAIDQCRALSGEELTAADLFNLDETGFDRDLSKKKLVVVPRDHGRARNLSSGNGDHITMVNCINALRPALKPYFLMKGKRRPSPGTKGLNSAGNITIDGDPEGCPFSMKESAYMTDEIWTEDVVPWLIPQMREVLPVEKRATKWQILILDGCLSHTMTWKAFFDAGGTTEKPSENTG